MASEEKTTTKPASPVHLFHGLTPVMPTGEESTTKPPSPVHLFRGLPTETDSNTPPAPARVVVRTHEAMNNSSGVKSNGEDNANGVHGSTDSSDGSSNQSSENQATENEEDDANKMVHTPVKRGRGRPPKPKTLSSEEAVVFGPARQRGRPRKYRDPLSAVSMSPKVSSGRGRGRPRKPLDPFSNDATPSNTGSTISTTKVETKTTTTTTTTKGFSSADASESTTISTTTESTTTTTVVKTS